MSKRPKRKAKARGSTRTRAAARKPVKKKASKRASAKRKPPALICDFQIFGLSIDDLDLVEYAKSSAETLETKYPTIVFTSGRRNAQQQADAMAPNVAKNRQWIKQTYLASDERDALQKWVDDNPDATDASDISAGLKGIMDGWTDAQKAKLSRHFSGQAFDVQPVAGSDGDEIKQFISQLPHLHKFLDSEGGLTIWHADFDTP